MSLIPAGEFVMGLPASEAGSELNPQKTAYLKSFLIDRFEVTNGQYKKCVGENVCQPPSLIIDYAKTVHEEGKEWYFDLSREKQPVVGLTWLQATIYCRWTGKRLPNAAEWEKAARGTDGRRFPWGDAWKSGYANWDEGGEVDGFVKIAPVGSFPQGASPYRVEDMAGNVREWVDEAILKGGSWYSNPDSLRSGDFGHEYTVERDDDMGFRCAKDLDSPNGTE